MAGVPFESIEQLATPRSIDCARKLIAYRAEQLKAKAEVERFFQSRERLLSTEAYHTLRVAVRTNRRPAQLTGTEPLFFSNYASAAGATETAEQEFHLLLGEEVSAARASLLTAARTFLESYFVFSAPGVRDFLAAHLERFPSDLALLPPRNNAARKVEQSLLLYLQRVAAKNDTFSQFGPTGWGRAVQKASRLEIEPKPGIAAREVFLERWTAHAIAAAVNADPDVFLELCPRLNPNGRVENGAFLNGENQERIALSAKESAIVERCDGRVPVHAFDDQSATVRDLVTKNVLRCALEVPALEPHAFMVLRDHVQKWRRGTAQEKWLPVFQSIAAFPEKFSNARESQERIRILNETRSSLNEVGAAAKENQRFLYSATNPIGEECFRECNFHVGQDLIDQVAVQAAPWIDLWRDTYAFVANRVAGGLRRILEKAAPGGESMPLPAFLRACEAAKLPLGGPGLVALSVMAFQEVKAAVRQRLLPHMDEEEYELTLEDCHVVRHRFEYPKFDEYTYPSADLQLSAESIEAVEQGRFQWIVSELHPPVAMLHHGFYWSCPDKNLLNQAFAQATAGRPNFHFGFFAADFTSHTTVRIFDAIPDLSYFVAPQPGNARWPTVRPADTEVFADQQTGDVCLRKSSSHEFLGSFARAWVIPLGFHPFQFGFAPHTPRLRCGGVIVQRRVWTVTSNEFPNGAYTGVSRELVMAMEKIRAEKNLPRYIYIRPTEQALRRSGAEGRDKDTKPVFIDLESYLFHEIFHRWLIKAGELEITEMLPDPDHLPWREADGRHTFELRTLIVPRS
ncbi:MAG: hypothetical protein QOH39_1477 [Verrucomicrobiota bacterium]|jgi:hypothetical protein